MTLASASAPAATPATPATPADATKPTSTPPASSGQPSAPPPAPAGPAATSQPAEDKAKAPADGGAAPAKPAEPAPKQPDPSGKKEGDAAAKTPAELKLPEGSLLNEADLEDIKAFAKEKGLTPEQTAMLVEREHQAVAAFHASQLDVHKEKVEGWKKSCAEDKEFGGSRFAESSEASSRALKAFFPPEFAKELEDTGYGWYPPLRTALTKIGLAMKDDTVALPTTAQQGAEDIPFHEKLYGKDGLGGGKK